MLQGGGIALTQGQAKRILLDAVRAELFGRLDVDCGVLWNPRYAGSSVPFALPSGATDQAALGALTFETANWGDVEPAAARIRATEAVLVMVVPGRDHLTVTI